MAWVVFPAGNLAEEFSTLLWDMCKHTTSQTTSMLRVITHPENGKKALEMLPDAQLIYVSRANKQPMRDWLDARVAEGLLNQTRVDNAKAAWQAASGQYRMMAALDALFDNRYRDDAFMVEQGWFSAEEDD